MRRPTRRPAPVPPFRQALVAAGWLPKTVPDPMLASLGIDDEYVYVERGDRLVHLHVSAGTIGWEAKRYVREPFGDYTTVYAPLGSGTGMASLEQFLEGRK